MEEESEKVKRLLLTDCDFIIFTQHYIVRGEVPVHNSFFFMKVAQSQYKLETLFRDSLKHFM